MKLTSLLTSVMLIPTIIFADQRPMWEWPVFKALAQIESGENDFAVGAKGERGRYQIGEEVFRDAIIRLNDVGWPISVLTAKHNSTLVASNHIQWINENFKRHTSRYPNHHEMYVMWNAGFTYYQKRDFCFDQVSPTIRDRAIRYANLVMLYEARN